MPLTPEQIADGWIEHDGLRQPVADAVIVEVLRRCGRVDKAFAWYFNTGHNDWLSMSMSDDIIAYKPENRHD